MRLYRWNGINAQGQHTNTFSLATHQQQLVTTLHAQGITPLTIRCLNTRTTRHVKRQLLQLFEQLAWLLQAYVPLAQALSQLPLAAQHPAAAALASELHQQVTDGISLAEAIHPIATWLAPEYHAFIAAGEASGQLSEMLSEVCRQQRQQQQLRHRLQQAMRYPLLLLLSTILMFLAMLLWVIPHYSGFLQELQTTLPPLTRGLLWMAQWIKPLILVWLFGMLALAVIGITLRHQPHFIRAWHRLVLGCPGIGNLVQQWQLYRWCYLMAAGTHTHLPLLTCLQLAQRSLSNVCLRQRFLPVPLAISHGHSLQYGLQQCHCFTPYALALLRIGEQTATLTQVFHCLAQHYEQRVLGAFTALTTWLEPFLLLGLGGFTALMIVAFYQPMIHLGLHL